MIFFLTSHTFIIKYEILNDKHEWSVDILERNKYSNFIIIITPRTPFFNFSSMNKDRYSGDLGLMFKKYSKSAAIICLNILSLLKE